MSSDAAVVSNPQPAPAAVKEDDEEFVPPPLVECDGCVKLQNQLEEAAVQQHDTNATLAATVAKLTEAEGEILSLNMRPRLLMRHRILVQCLRKRPVDVLPRVAAALSTSMTCRPHSSLLRLIFCSCNLRMMLRCTR